MNWTDGPPCVAQPRGNILESNFPLPPVRYLNLGGGEEEPAKVTIAAWWVKLLPHGYIHDVISYFLFLMIKEEEEVPLDI